MKFFKLPDLGEGLSEAEIVEWHVREGDMIKTDELLVSVETAKAIVEVPAPRDGKIMALFGAPGDLVHVGEPLVEFADGEDSGTVVGELKRSRSESQDDFYAGAVTEADSLTGPYRISPLVKAMAERLEVDWQLLKPARGIVVTATDVERAAQAQDRLGQAEVLRGVRRTMARNMEKAHREVVPVSLFDEVDIHDWPQDQDLTMRLVAGIAQACEAEPALNAWFDAQGPSRRLLKDVHIGIAVDMDAGLFVPVLRDVGHRSMADLRRGLNAMREDIRKREIPPAEMQGATITLSNFGMLGGRFATPIVSPPQVAIVGAGEVYERVVQHHSELCARRHLPLSLTFDHRAATGGEAARFLRALKDFLGQKMAELL